MKGNKIITWVCNQTYLHQKKGEEIDHGGGGGGGGLWNKLKCSRNGQLKIIYWLMT